ncbi:hypothetical protein ACQEPB_15385 [Novosphingobium fluoreni]
MSKTADADAPHYSALDARGGEIILRTPRHRWIFVGGLIGAGILAIIGLA